MGTCPKGPGKGPLGHVPYKAKRRYLTGKPSNVNWRRSPGTGRVNSYNHVTEVGLSTNREKGYDKRMKKVITYGTFDLIHHGHINILRRAKAMGDYLIVALSTDEFNAGKGKEVYYAYEERKQILEAIKYVDEVIPETRWEQKVDDVVKNGVAVFVIGEDWKGKFDFLKPYCEVVYLPRTEGISTTQIKNDLKK